VTVQHAGAEGATAPDGYEELVELQGLGEVEGGRPRLIGQGRDQAGPLPHVDDAGGHVPGRCAQEDRRLVGKGRTGRLGAGGLLRCGDGAHAEVLLHGLWVSVPSTVARGLIRRIVLAVNCSGSTSVPQAQIPGVVFPAGRSLESIGTEVLTCTDTDSSAPSRRRWRCSTNDGRCSSSESSSRAATTSTSCAAASRGCRPRSCPSGCEASAGSGS